MMYLTSNNYQNKIFQKLLQKIVIEFKLIKTNATY